MLLEGPEKSYHAAKRVGDHDIYDDRPSGNTAVHRLAGGTKGVATVRATT